MDPTEMLKQLGLDEKEIIAYLALLEMGEASVLTLSRKSGLKRPTTYLILDALERKELVSRSVRGKKITYLPQHPKKILIDAEHRVAQLKEMLPQFDALMQRGDDKPRVMIYEGKDALDRAYDDMFITKGEVVFLSNVELVEDIFTRTLSKFEYAASAELRSREIIDDSDRSRAYARRANGPYRKVRFLPDAFPRFETDIGVFGNNTVITSGHKEYFSVRIVSEEIANAFRSMFEAMWQLSTETENPASVPK